MSRTPIEPTAELIVYVPDPEDPIGAIYAKDLAAGCAIICAKVSPTERAHAAVYLEASRASNVVTFADRVYHAADRLVHQAPTHARAMLPVNALRAVGTFVLATRALQVTDEPALAGWLGMPDGKVPPSEFETQSKAPVDPEQLVQRFCIEVPDGVVASVHGWRPDDEHQDAHVARGCFGQFSYEDARGGLMVAGADDGRAFAFYLLERGWQLLVPATWPHGTWVKWPGREDHPDTLARCRKRDLTLWQFDSSEALHAFLATILPAA
jgi:hypothetical protein